MGRKRSVAENLNWEIWGVLYVGFLLIYTATIALGLTNPADVGAINSFYLALGSPVLPGWVASGGDPCAEKWQGVACNGTYILSIVLNGANLGGELSDQLGSFASIRAIDLSNNHIGGSIPSNLPGSMRNFFLSANNFSGSIPDTLSSLTLLTDMSLNNNFLSGEIPDAFQLLTGLINLDLSSNNLSGHLPPSFTYLASLTTFHVQDNQLSGTLDVLQDLNLKDLNVENNLFIGPIPEKLLLIPNFRKDGNLFNSTAAPLPAPSSPSIPPAAPLPSGTPPTPSSSGASSTPLSGKTPAGQADGPSSAKESSSKGKSSLSTKKVVWIVIAAIILLTVLALAFLLFMPTCRRRREDVGRTFKRHQVGAYKGNRENMRDQGPLVQPTNETQKVPKETAINAKDDHNALEEIKQRNMSKMDRIPRREEHSIDMSRLDIDLMPPPPPPAPLPPVEKVIVQPILPTEVSTGRPSTKSQNPQASARSFTIALLQQYTNSFSQENLIGEGMLGSVYKAHLSNGKLLAIKKLDKRASSQQKDEEFIELVNNIDRIRHANVVELMGYCAEHGQRLLIYEYCSNGTLQDALHADDEFKKKLPWNARIRMALGAARALEYLHEVCQPPVVHRNFKSANILLDDDLNVHVSDCGLAPLITSGSVSQLSGQLLTAYGYGAPEFESGIYTAQSDVYSFGVVMLELLTGRKSHDRTRTRGEQFLVRWAIPQLHDINTLSRMVDPSLKGEYTAKSLSHFADVISRCIQSGPEFRPPMSEVVQDLTDIIRRERPSNESIGD